MPSDVIGEYRNFVALGAINFSKGRTVSEDSQSKLSTEPQSRIRLKSVMKINTVVSSSSINTGIKENTKKYLLIYT